MTEFTLPKLDEAEQRLDAVFAEAFGADHPALQDWVAIKFALKERAQAVEALSPFALFGTQFAGRDDILTRIAESPDKVQGLPVGAFKTAVETFCKLFPDWHPELRQRVGCAACDRGDFQLGHHHDCSNHPDNKR